MGTIADYTRNAILEDIKNHLDSLVPATIKTVTLDMPVLTAAQLRKSFPKSALPAVCIVDPPTPQTEGVTSGLAGRSPVNRYQTDYRVGLIGLAELLKTDNPQDVVLPIFSAVFAKLLAPKTPGGAASTSSLSRGGNALSTYPESTAHSGRTQGDRIYFSMGFNCPFEWGVDPD